jgi:hypothetical protein
MIEAAQVLTVERLEGESFLTRLAEHLNFEFLPGAWFLILCAKDNVALGSTEPSINFVLLEGEPFGAEGSLEAPAGTFSLSRNIGSEQAGRNGNAVLFIHRLTDAFEHHCVLKFTIKTTGIATVKRANEFLSEGIVDG